MTARGEAGTAGAPERAGTHPFALSEDQLAAFDRDGFLVLRAQLPADAVDGLHRAFAVAVDRLARSWGADDLPPPEAGYDARFRALAPRLGGRVPAAWRKILVTPEVHAMWALPELLGPIRSLVGDEVDAHGIWNGRPRLPGEHREQVLWHQDAHYYRSWDPGDGALVSAWMPLVPVDRAGSCLEFAAGSHRGGVVERLRAETGLFTVADEALAPYEQVAAEMAPGDVVLFGATTLHQSTRNTSDRIRWSLDLRFAEATPALAAKGARGYRCHSTADPASVEPFDVWAARYEYEPVELADELENFAGLDRDAVRDWLGRTTARADVY